MSEHEELETLERLISGLDESVPGPNPLRMASARRQFLEHAARLRAEKGRAMIPPIARQPGAPSFFRLATTGLGALILTAGSLTGVAYASNPALPGDPLYGIDRAVEALQLNLSPSRHSTVELLLAQAEERLAESEALAALNDAPGMKIALLAYSQTILSLEQIAGLETVDQTALFELISRALAAHEQRLLALLESGPEAAVSGLTQALEAAQEAHENATPNGPPDENPGNGPPDENPGNGPPEEPPGNGPPEENPGSGPPEENPGNGPPEDPPGNGPPEDPPGGGPPGEPPGQGGKP